VVRVDDSEVVSFVQRVFNARGGFTAPDEGSRETAERVATTVGRVATRAGAGNVNVRSAGVDRFAVEFDVADNPPETLNRPVQSSLIIGPSGNAINADVRFPQAPPTFFDQSEVDEAASRAMEAVELDTVGFIRLNQVIANEHAAHIDLNSLDPDNPVFPAEELVRKMVRAGEVFNEQLTGSPGETGGGRSLLAPDTADAPDESSGGGGLYAPEPSDERDGGVPPGVPETFTPPTIYSENGLAREVGISGKGDSIGTELITGLWVPENNDVIVAGAAPSHGFLFKRYTDFVGVPDRVMGFKAIQRMTDDAPTLEIPGGGGGLYQGLVDTGLDGEVTRLTGGELTEPEGLYASVYASLATQPLSDDTLVRYSHTPERFADLVNSTTDEYRLAVLRRDLEFAGVSVPDIPSYSEKRDERLSAPGDGRSLLAPDTGDAPDDVIEYGRFTQPETIPQSHREVAQILADAGAARVKVSEIEAGEVTTLDVSMPGYADEAIVGGSSTMSTGMSLSTAGGSEITFRFPTLKDLKTKPQDAEIERVAERVLRRLERDVFPDADRTRVRTLTQERFVAHTPHVEYFAQGPPVDPVEVTERFVDAYQSFPRLVGDVLGRPVDDTFEYESDTTLFAPGSDPDAAAERLVERVERVEGTSAEIAENQSRGFLVEFFPPDQDPLYPCAVVVGFDGTIYEATLRLGPLGNRTLMDRSEIQNLEGRWTDVVLDAASGSGMLSAFGTSRDFADLGDEFVSDLLRPHVRLRLKEDGYDFTVRQMGRFYRQLVSQFRDVFGTYDERVNNPDLAGDFEASPYGEAEFRAPERNRRRPTDPPDEVAEAIQRLKLAFRDSRWVKDVDTDKRIGTAGVVDMKFQWPDDVVAPAEPDDRRLDDIQRSAVILNDEGNAQHFQLRLPPIPKEGNPPVGTDRQLTRRLSGAVPIEVGSVNVALADDGTTYTPHVDPDAGAASYPLDATIEAIQSILDTYEDTVLSGDSGQVLSAPDPEAFADRLRDVVADVSVVDVGEQTTVDFRLLSASGRMEVSSVVFDSDGTVVNAMIRGPGLADPELTPARVESAIRPLLLEFDLADSAVPRAEGLPEGASGIRPHVGISGEVDPETFVAFLDSLDEEFSNLNRMV